MGNKRPSPRRALVSLLLSPELPRDPPRTSRLPPKHEWSAACPPGGAAVPDRAERDPEPTLTSARPGWVVIPRPGAFTFACLSRPVSSGPLLVTSRSSPAANHIVCTSPPALASAIVFLLLSFSIPEELAQVSPAPPQPGELPPPPLRSQQVTLSVILKWSLHIHEFIHSLLH